LQFCISYSSKRNTFQREKTRATIVLTDKPDIRIILKEENKLTEIGVEITEVFSLSSSKGSVYKLVTQEAKRAERKGEM
jgi:hypothetical protein